MTHAPASLPNLTPLADVAKLLGIPPRRLVDRARARQFSHIRIGKERYVTDPQLEALFATFTEEKETPQGDRDRAIQETRDRLERQSRRRSPRQRSAA
ncbi:hypothetical protein [Verrucosispora sp. TAA-831]|uniref:hypothetical protein n=1 Tax=Verrucosispora sp. TAA-831 TaxID=3422227 RepID=UPI003D6E9687